MKTKFILHGGASNRKTEDNRKFFLDVLNSVESSNVRILCIYFARPEHRRNESFEEDKSIFFSLDTPKKFELHQAKFDIEELRDQVTHSDVVFIQGGMKGCLKERLEELGNLSEMVKGKVVVGISAGANMLSKYYHSSVAHGVREGLGVLPIKMFCHYTEKNIDELEELNKYKEKLPVYKIHEEKFSVIEVDCELFSTSPNKAYATNVQI